MIFIGKLKGDDKEIEFSFSDIVYADGGFFVVTNQEGIDVHIVESTVRALEVDRLRAELAAAPRWVPVTEALPRPRDAEDFFLARLENGTRVEAMHNGTSWWEFDSELGDYIPLVGVTHWYQVPALTA